MSYVFIPRDAAELALLPEKCEVILSLAELSRRGVIREVRDGVALARSARARGLRVLLDWDALMEEPRFLQLSARVKELAAEVDVIRVRDAGAARFVRDELTHPLHLLLEAGHHNLLALESWRQRLGARLERVVVSPELSRQTLKAWQAQLQLPLEILALGPLLLFHSPRALLSVTQDLPALPEEGLFASGKSLESPHKGFPLEENRHGTLMYHPKDLALLERWSELVELPGVVLRFDHTQTPRASDLLGPLLAFLAGPAEDTLSALRAAWPREWMRGYWDSNRSDVLFEKLTNQHLVARENLVAEVIEGQKDNWLAVQCRRQKLKVGERYQVITPLGKEKEFVVSWLKDCAWRDTAELAPGEVGFVPWSGGCVAKTQLLSIP